MSEKLDEILESLNSNKDDSDFESKESSGESDSENKKKHQRLAGKTPLFTVFALSFGPLMSQLAGSVYGFINSVWISKSEGEVALSAIALSTSFDMIGRAFGFLLSVAASSKISALFALGKDNEAPQVICDLLRLSLLFGILVAVVMCPIEPICVRWFGATEDVIRIGYIYIAPIFIGSFVTCGFLSLSGSLQAEGRTTLVGFITLLSLIFSVFVLVPLFLFVFKFGIFGAGLATVLGELFPLIYFFVQYFREKYNVKPKWNLFLKKFSPHTLPAVKVGLSQLISNLSGSIPGIVVRKLIGLASANSGENNYNAIMAGFNIFIKIWQISTSIMIAFGMGYLPAASYAFAAENNIRFLKLTAHLLWISFLISVALFLVCFIFPREISMLFVHEAEFLDWGKEILYFGNIASFLLFIRFNSQVILQARGLACRATVISIFSQFLIVIGAMVVLYFTKSDDPLRIIFCYPITHVCGLILGSILLAGPLYDVYKKHKEKVVNDANFISNNDDPLQEAKRMSEN